MEKNTWKILAIIFFVLFLIENLIFVWGLYTVSQDEKDINNCYYNTCEEFPEADFDNGLCTCYDYDLIGNLVIAKTEYKK